MAITDRLLSKTTSDSFLAIQVKLNLAYASKKESDVVFVEENINAKSHPTPTLSLRHDISFLLSCGHITFEFTGRGVDLPFSTRLFPLRCIA